MNTGWTKHYRKKWEKGYHKDWLLWIMMDYFIDFANHADKEIFVKNYGKVLIKRGQHLFSYRKLAEFFGTTRQKIRARCELMKNMDFLTIKSTNKWSIATVVNYKEYQGDTRFNKDCQPTDKPTDQPMPNPRSTTNKNEKNEKKKRKERDAHPIDKIKDDRVNIPALKDFYDDRKERRKTMTKRSITMVINKLVKHTKAEQRIMVDDAIEKGWQSVFPSSLEVRTRSGKKESLPEGFWDPYSTKQFKEQNKKYDKIPVTSKNVEVSLSEDPADYPIDPEADDIDWESLSPDERKNKWAELKAKSLKR